MLNKVTKPVSNPSRSSTNSDRAQRRQNSGTSSNLITLVIFLAEVFFTIVVVAFKVPTAILIILPLTALIGVKMVMNEVKLEATVVDIVVAILFAGCMGEGIWIAEHSHQLLT